jgi:hypothetical protein
MSKAEDDVARASVAQIPIHGFLASASTATPEPSVNT